MLSIRALAGYLCPLIFAAASLWASPVLDQSNDAPVGGGGNINEGNRLLAQTYTAGITGTLAAVTVDVGFPQASFPLHVAIRTVVGGLPTDVILGEVTLSTTASDFLSLIPFPSGIEQLAGTEYAIVLDYPAAPPAGVGQVVAFWSLATGNPYAGGMIVALGGPNGLSTYPEFDFRFQTFVNPVPEPSSFALVSLGTILSLRLYARRRA